MAWVNETAPENRDVGWAVAASLWGEPSTFVSAFTLLNGASSSDIFDPDRDSSLDSFYLASAPGATSLNHREAWLRVDFGGGRVVTKIRVRYGTSTPWPASDRKCNAVLVYGGFTTSSWTLLGSFFIQEASRLQLGVDSHEILINNENPFRYYKFSWILNRAHPGCGAMVGVDLYSGSFDSEQEEQEAEYTAYTNGDTPVSAFSFSDGYPPENVLDGQQNTNFRNANDNTNIVFDLGKSLVVNTIKCLNSLRFGGYNTVYYSNLYGSNNGSSYTKIHPGSFLFNPHLLPETPLDINLKLVNNSSYRYYLMDFSRQSGASDEISLGAVELGHTGRWVLLLEDLPARDITESSTHPMLIASREPFACSAQTGAVTSGEESEELWQNRITRQPIEASGVAGIIAGEYDFEIEDFYIEREISVLGHSAPIGVMSKPVRDMQGLAGFGRQCNGAITIWYSVEGSTGEFALMTDGVRSRYEMEGHCGTRAEMTRQLSMAGFAQPGTTSNATLFRQPLTMSALAGAIAGGTRTVEVSATALQHLFASLASSLPARTALATAVVNGMSWGDCTLHSRQMDAEAVVSLFSHGSQTVPARWAEGQAMTGGLTSADLMLPTYTVEAQGVVDALATAHFLRTNYRMAGKTRGSRFDTYLLKYEAPL